jgi:Bacteriocin-protection, YdeI or OmpD-Associated/Domain of unknown function (DUF1905)
MRFRTAIRQTGKTTTGIVIPDEVIAALGGGKKPPVQLTVNGYTYRSTVATVNGQFMVGLNADHRAASGLEGGQEVDVDIELDTAPRTVDVPADFQEALDGEPAAKATFEKLSNSLKRYHVDHVLGAKSDETRRRRMEKSIAVLREGKPR